MGRRSRRWKLKTSSSHLRSPLTVITNFLGVQSQQPLRSSNRRGVGDRVDFGHAYLGQAASERAQKKITAGTTALLRSSWAVP